MKNLWKILGFLLWTVSILAALLMIFAAFSQVLNPVRFPMLSLAGFLFPPLALLNILLVLFFLVLRRFRFIWLPLLSLLMCIGQLRTCLPLNAPVETKPEGSLKILSYNTMSLGHLEKEDGVNRVLEYLKASDADIICLQEYGVGGNKKLVTQADVNKALADYPYKATKLPKGQKDMASIAIYSKLPVLKTERIGMQSNSNGAMAYKIKWGMDTLLLVNCHLESYKLTSEDKELYEQMIEKHEKEQMKAGAKVLVKKLAEAAAIRAPQADSIASYLNSHPYIYKVVCGDLNDIPFSYTHQVLTRDLHDAFTESGRGFGISYHANKLLFRIDHLLVSEALKTKNCTIDDSIQASDHYPIWAYVEKN